MDDLGVDATTRVAAMDGNRGVRRRNSPLIRSSALVERNAFHCELGKRRKVNNVSPASSTLSTTAGQRNRHFFVKRTRAPAADPDLGIPPVHEHIGAAGDGAWT